MLLVFGHLLAASMALGAIVATDLRLLSKLSQDKVRIAPPNPFVARIVMLALLLLYATGGAIVLQGLGERADYLDNPKLQAKIALVIVLTLNAFVLHYVTFPRLARGRRVPRWNLIDWIVVAVPVAVSNFLWMFTAFLGIARAWNYTTPMRDILEIAAGALPRRPVRRVHDPRHRRPQRPARPPRLGRPAGALARRRGQPRPCRAGRRGGETVVAASPQQQGGSGQCLAPRRRVAAAGDRARPLTTHASGASPRGRTGRGARPAIGALAPARVGRAAAAPTIVSNR